MLARPRDQRRRQAAGVEARQVNVYAFHLDVPQGAPTIDADFQYLSPVQPSGGAA